MRRRFAVRVWWHCLVRTALADYGHRTCYVTFFRHDPKTRLYYCSCGHLELQAWRLWDTGELELPSGATGRFSDGGPVT